MLVHPPGEGFFRREFWNLEGITRLTVRRETYLVRILVIDADTHYVEVHHCAQLACEKSEKVRRGSSRNERLRNAQKCLVSLGCRCLCRALDRAVHYCLVARI